VSVPPAINGARAAFVFLTRLPVGGFPYSKDDWRWASGHFPLVGAEHPSVGGRKPGDSLCRRWITDRSAGVRLCRQVQRDVGEHRVHKDAEAHAARTVARFPHVFHRHVHVHRDVHVADRGLRSGHDANRWRSGRQDGVNPSNTLTGNRPTYNGP
jgi:hypothetical protein